MDAAEKRRRRRRSKFRWYEAVAFIALLVIFVVSAVMLGKYFLTAEKEQSEFDTLAELVYGPPDQSGSGAAASESTAQEEQELSLDQLFALNSDTFGWISIPDTRLDYPVMHTPDDPEKYLRKSFYGAYADSGVPFLEAQCTADSSNLIIYGHNMKSGSMFHALEGYLDAAYYSAHPTISLTTAEGETLYDVMAVLHFQITAENISTYYAIPQTAEQFDAYVAGIRAAALYDLHTTASWGTRLLTLSTCDNITDDGRILVIARAK